ncbi:putative pentatricopeptide repeat-containing protein At1g12700, mitochondrial [Papaver somniferum]|uniref:putative pentatricopeptide repeat-containing protein At1g12700, mitochondrial n=1 Tax=Papaver somniferum TaxID=3469 RepID=UPI000E70527B|nr:putative pentatricopeptide repeat-containing protein At1g12700, mitochondrial [Papaver somniferum]
MIERGVQPNTITCNTIITGLCRVGELVHALDLLRNMAKWNCEANVVSYSVIIDTLLKTGLVDEALHLFSEMIDDSNIAPHIILYNSLINGLCKNDRLSEAVRLLDSNSMSSRGVSANSCTYNSLMGFAEKTAITTIDLRIGGEEFEEHGELRVFADRLRHEYEVKKQLKLGEIEKKQG